MPSKATPRRLAETSFLAEFHLDDIENPTMKTNAAVLMTALVTLVVTNSALAHPGSGIAVDREGQVYFTQTNGKGTWKVNTKGERTLVNERRDHWLAIDQEGFFFALTLKRLSKDYTGRSEAHRPRLSRISIHGKS